MSPFTPAEAANIAQEIGRCGCFVAATCPKCHMAKRPYRDVLHDDRGPCGKCVMPTPEQVALLQFAMPRGVFRSEDKEDVFYGVGQLPRPFDKKLVEECEMAGWIQMGEERTRGFVTHLGREAELRAR